MEFSAKEIEERIAAMYPNRSKEEWGNATKKVLENQQEEGPIGEVDRLFLAGRDGEHDDLSCLIERTKVKIRGEIVARRMAERAERAERAIIRDEHGGVDVDAMERQRAADAREASERKEAS